jgi:hypothetical protein
MDGVSVQMDVEGRTLLPAKLWPILSGGGELERALGVGEDTDRLGAADLLGWELPSPRTWSTRATWSRASSKP